MNEDIEFIIRTYSWGAGYRLEKTDKAKNEQRSGNKDGREEKVVSLPKGTRRSSNEELSEKKWHRRKEEGRVTSY